MKYVVDKISAVRADTEGASKLDIKSTASAWMAIITNSIDCIWSRELSHSANKQCHLDPAPTWLIKQFRHLLAPFITKLINVSLHTGCFPQKHKHAIVFPRLKKDNLDPTELKNYKPISNLTFMSNLLLSAVQKRLYSHSLIRLVACQYIFSQPEPIDNDTALKLLCWKSSTIYSVQPTVVNWQLSVS